MFNIYQITNQLNGKIYIGKTCGPINTRLSEHFSDARCGRGFYFHNAIRKHGYENFTIKQLDQTNLEQYANWLESFYIGLLHSNSPKFGYNITMGGDGMAGWHPSDETKMKISKSEKGKIVSEEAKQKMRLGHLGKSAWWLKGKSLSEERRKKISEAKSGKPTWNKGLTLSEEHRKHLSESHKGQTPWNKGKHLK